MENLHKQKTSC